MNHALVPAAVLAAALLGGCGGGHHRDDPLRRGVIDVNGHVVVMKRSLEFAEYRSVMAVARDDHRVVRATPFVFVEATLSAGSQTVAGGLKGIAIADTPLAAHISPPGALDGARLPPDPAAADPGPPPPRSPSTLDPAPDDFAPAPDRPPLDLSGDQPVAAPGVRAAPPIDVVVGKEIPALLGVEVGAVVDLVVAAPIDASSWKADLPPRRRAARIVGVLTTGTDFDARLVLTTFELGQDVIDGGDQVTGVELRTTGDRVAARVARDLGARLGEEYLVIDWCELNKAALHC